MSIKDKELTTIYVSKEAHKKIKELADKTGMKIYVVASKAIEAYKEEK